MLTYGTKLQLRTLVFNWQRALGQKSAAEAAGVPAIRLSPVYPGFCRVFVFRVSFVFNYLPGFSGFGQFFVFAARDAYSGFLRESQTGGLAPSASREIWLRQGIGFGTHAVVKKATL